ncbi:hypothetical protein D9M70_617760 [compost metagenome]
MGELGLDIALDEAVGDVAQGARRLEQRGDIAKYHARLREVGHGADQGFQVELVENHAGRHLVRAEFQDAKV